MTNQGIIQGAGQIGVGQLTLVNSGTINANQSAGMTINANPSFTNNGSLAVSAGDLMHVTGGTFSNFGNGVLRAVPIMSPEPCRLINSAAREARS